MVVCLSEIYSEFCQTSKIEGFSILDVSQCFEYAPFVSEKIV